MDKSKISQAEKLQTKLDKLLQTKEKKQAAFEKSKRELEAVTKQVDSVKLKLFEILQSGSDDATFSNWAKRKIGESGNAPNPEKPEAQNHQPHKPQNHQTNALQNQNQR